MCYVSDARMQCGVKIVYISQQIRYGARNIEFMCAFMLCPLCCIVLLRRSTIDREAEQVIGKH
jgi:hypothetical protein